MGFISGAIVTAVIYSVILYFVVRNNKKKIKALIDKQP